MMTYILLANIYLAVFYTFYYLFLRKETFFKTNRFFLLFSLFFAFILPMANFPLMANISIPFLSEIISNSEGAIGLNAILLNSLEISSDQNISQSAFPLSDNIISNLTLIYLLGVGISLSIFIYRIFCSIKIFKKEQTTAAFSFFKWICIGKEWENQLEIKIHENVHIKEWHSIDIMLIQLIKMINWFNPFAYALERSIKLQHEYYADKVASGIHRAEYAQLLVANAFDVPSHVLINQFNHPTILKSRIMMLLKNKTPKKNALKLLLLIPVVIGMIGLSSASQSSDKLDSSPTQFMEDMGKISQDTTAFVPMDKLEIHPKPRNAEYNSIHEFRLWITKNFIIPKEALDAKVSGLMEATFIIDEDGKISDVEINKDLGYGTGEVLKRLLEKSHKWSPGIINGQAVTTKFTLPLRINLSLDKK